METIAGLRVGHHRRLGRGWRTGTTVVVSASGAVGGVDVRGGGPGTRETDLLRPENLVERVHAVCLTGGSAFGLSAATGVMNHLESRGIGFPVGPELDHVVPIVPAAVIYDLGRGGVFANRPDAGFGTAAAIDATRPRRRVTPRFDTVRGAGTGAIAGGLQGGLAEATEVVVLGADGPSVTVAALAVVNSVGSVIDPSSGLPFEAGSLRLRRPDREDRRRLADHLGPTRQPLNTTIGIVAVSALLTKAECAKFAGVAHDGMARAVRPAHTLFDGDTIFALAAGDLVPELPAAGPRGHAAALTLLFEAGARCFARACTDAVVRAGSISGGSPSYRDLCPSAFRRLG